MRRQGHVCWLGASRPVPEPEQLALKHEAFVQGTSNLFGLAEILVITAGLASEKGVNAVVKVVAPDCVESIASAVCGPHQLGVVFVGLGDNANSATEFTGELLHVALNFLKD